jgi:hypothetical protein
MIVFLSVFPLIIILLAGPFSLLLSSNTPLPPNFQKPKKVKKEKER